MNNNSRSAISFIELKNKAEEIYDFGNDWGLYVDIEIQFYNFREQKIKINRNTYPLFKIVEVIDEGIYDDKHDDNYSNNKDYENYSNNCKKNENEIINGDSNCKIQKYNKSFIQITKNILYNFIVTIIILFGVIYLIIYFALLDI